MPWEIPGSVISPFWSLRRSYSSSVFHDSPLTLLPCETMSGPSAQNFL